MHPTLAVASTSPRLVHVEHLSLGQAAGHLRLREIVRPRRPAAPVALAHLDQLQAGDALEQRPRLRADLLAVA